MIHVKRPKEVPRILDEKGNPETQKNCRLYDESPHAYETKSFSKSLKREIYAHESVREKLKEAQHEKCCYCESILDGTSPPEIEHFRPKSAVRQEAGSRKEFPGYYWLAYSWTNLLVCCRDCNSKKSDFFPLMDESERARNHRNELDFERPLFVDPAGEDPRDHIDFLGSTIRGRTSRGRTTIQFMQLSRSGLEELRRGKLAHIRSALTIVKLADKLASGIIEPCEVEEARTLLNDAILPKATYCAMALDFLESKGVSLGQE